MQCMYMSIHVRRALHVLLSNGVEMTMPMDLAEIEIMSLTVVSTL